MKVLFKVNEIKVSLDQTKNKYVVKMQYEQDRSRYRWNVSADKRNIIFVDQVSEKDLEATVERYVAAAKRIAELLVDGYVSFAYKYNNPNYPCLFDGKKYLHLSLVAIKPRKLVPKTLNRITGFVGKANQKHRAHLHHQKTEQKTKAKKAGLLENKAIQLQQTVVSKEILIGLAKTLPGSTTVDQLIEETDRVEQQGFKLTL